MTANEDPKKKAIDKIKNAQERVRARGRARKSAPGPRLLGWVERKVSAGTQVAIPAATIRSWGTEHVLLADLGYAVIIVPHQGTAEQFVKSWSLDRALEEQLKLEGRTMPRPKDKDGNERS